MSSLSPVLGYICDVINGDSIAHCHNLLATVTIGGQNGRICSGSHNRGKQGGRERGPIMMESCGQVDSRAGQADFFLYALYAF